MTKKAFRGFPGVTRRATAIAVVALATLLLGGCGDVAPSGTAGGGSFDFVSPGGKTELFYDPPSSRGTVGVVTGSSLTDPNATVGLADFTGKIVVINVWGQWCGPCRGEADDLNTAYTQVSGNGGAFLGINFRDNRQAAQDFVGDRKVQYPSIFDPAGRTLLSISRSFPTSVVPVTLILDRQHRVAAVFLRSVTADDVTAEVDKLAAEP